MRGTDIFSEFVEIHSREGLIEIELIYERKMSIKKHIKVSNGQESLPV